MYIHKLIMVNYMSQNLLTMRRIGAMGHWVGLIIYGVLIYRALRKKHL